MFFLCVIFKINHGWKRGDRMKIKYSLLDRLCNLTNKEVDFLLYVAHYQDDYGRIRGIYYRDVCQACDMCKQTFYDVLRSLQQKGVITYVRADRDYNITILDNDFSYKGSYEEGYINVSRSVFDTDKFNRLRAKEKIFVLHLMKVTHENAKSFQIRTENFYKKYTELLGVTKKILRGYLHSMRSFFSVGKKDGKYFITFLASVFKARRDVSETDQLLGHEVKTHCRRCKIKDIDSQAQAVEDTMQLVKQYRPEAKERGVDILDVLQDCIWTSVQGFKHRVLNPKYVHKLIRIKLGLENDPWPVQVEQN